MLYSLLKSKFYVKKRSKYYDAKCYKITKYIKLFKTNMNIIVLFVLSRIYNVEKRYSKKPK